MYNLLTFEDGLGFWVDPPTKDSESENFDTNTYEEDDAFNVLVVGWWKEHSVFLIELNKDDTWNAKLIKTFWKSAGGFHISKVFNDVCLKCKWFAQKAVWNKNSLVNDILIYARPWMISPKIKYFLIFLPIHKRSSTL